MAQYLEQLRALEGQNVLIALADGSRMDDCLLVSVRRGRSGSLWLVDHGHDRFVSLSDVVDIWPVRPFVKRRVA